MVDLINIFSNLFNLFEFNRKQLLPILISRSMEWKLEISARTNQWTIEQNKRRDRRKKNDCNMERTFILNSSIIVNIIMIIECAWVCLCIVCIRHLKWWCCCCCWRRRNHRKNIENAKWRISRVCLDTMDAISFGKCMGDCLNKKGSELYAWVFYTKANDHGKREREGECEEEKYSERDEQNEGFGTVKSKN